MAGLKVTFTLSARDVDHLRRAMRQAKRIVIAKGERAIIGAALVLAREVRKFSPPQYVLERVQRIESLVDVLNDPDWAPPAPVRRTILAALAYFTDPEDLIADPVPGLGFLDDAIIIELVSRDLRHEMAAYHDFCRFRDTAVQRPWTRSGQAVLARRLADRRLQLRGRIERAEGRL